jgi:hypothetical protein
MMTQAHILPSSTCHSFSIVVTQSPGHVICRENRAPRFGYQFLCRECQRCNAEPGSRSNGTAHLFTTPPIRINVSTTRLPKVRTHRAYLSSAVTSVTSTSKGHLLKTSRTYIGGLRTTSTEFCGFPPRPMPSGRRIHPSHEWTAQLLFFRNEALEII